MQNEEKDLRLRSNIRNWSLVTGALIILAACIFSYLLTKPAEADVSIQQDLSNTFAIRSA